MPTKEQVKDFIRQTRKETEDAMGGVFFGEEKVTLAGEELDTRDIAILEAALENMRKNVDGFFDDEEVVGHMCDGCGRVARKEESINRHIGQEDYGHEDADAVPLVRGRIG